MNREGFAIGAVASLTFAAFVAFVEGCDPGESVPTIDCSTAAVPRYSELGEALSYCTRCHGAGRGDAGVALATYDDAVSVADESVDAIADGSMPPRGAMPEAQRQAFYTWAQCGAPE